MHKLVLLEFNEINQRVLRDLVAAGQLPNFKRLMGHGQTVTTIVDEAYEKLEPWIQWVTAHTGKTQAEHKAFNLSDVQHSQLQQVWDVLESRGIACGLVSPMNARRGQLSKGFFVPDPWSVSDDSYPPMLDPIYRFIAERVQQHNISLEQGSSKLGFLKACLRAGVPATALARLGAAYVAAKLDPRKKWRLAAALDRFLWDITDALRKKFDTRFTAVFLNAVAHYQHHYWTEHQGGTWRQDHPVLFGKRNPVSERNLNPGDDPIAFGLRCYDDIVGAAIKSVGVGAVVVLTGLSQIPFEGYEAESGFYLYRPTDHAKLFGLLGLPCSRIAPLMSRDAMLYFANQTDQQRALDILASTKVNGRPVFQYSAESDQRVFAKVIYSYDVQDADAVTASSMDQPLRWGEHFTLITFKTGHHHPEGTVIAPAPALRSLLAADGRMPLACMPALVFQMLRLQDAQAVAQDLQLSAA